MEEPRGAEAGAHFSVLRVGLGIGLIICVLLSVALALFGVTNLFQTIAVLLALAGIWTLIHGLFIGREQDRLYHIGLGVIVALLSTFIFLPIQYTLGLVVVSIMIVIVVGYTVARPRRLLR